MVILRIGRARPNLCGFCDDQKITSSAQKMRQEVATEAQKSTTLFIKNRLFVLFPFWEQFCIFVLYAGNSH